MENLSQEIELFREIAQNIAKTLKNYQEFAVWNRIELCNDELSVQQSEDSSTVSQLLAQIQDLQDKVNSLSDARKFYGPETACSSGASHVGSGIFRVLEV